MKKCTKCKIVQPSENFSKHSKSSDGFQPWCKECCISHRKIRMKEPEYHAKRNAEIREYHRNNNLSRLRNKMREFIRRVSPTKLSSSQKILGYSAQELLRHIESQFQPGMTWENRSEWHIDHIKPISVFLAEGIDDIKIINSLSNLQPMWAHENLSKGAHQ